MKSEEKPKRKTKKKQEDNWIKNWPEDERPREKLFKHGEHMLSDTGLLAVLLRTGTNGQSAIDLARRIIQKFKTFRNMSHTDIRDWKEFKGVGKAKIAQIRAATEIGRRLAVQDTNQTKVQIKSTDHVVALFKARMCGFKNEVFKVIYCDPQNRIIDIAEIAQGTPTSSCPLIREILSQALQRFASGVICLHNHPNGKPIPSKEDTVFTEELRKATELMEVKLLDHIIYGEDAFYSFDLNSTKDYGSL